MKRIIILWTLLMASFLGHGQKCSLVDTLQIPLDDVITYDIEVADEYFTKDLVSNQLCEVEITFEHQLVYDLEIDLISPAGQRVTLIGPRNGPTTCCTGFTLGSQWDISFVQDGAVANPDIRFIGRGDRWDNTIYDFGFGGINFTGSFKPFAGRLEDFNMGTVHGTWKLEIRNLTSINGNTPSEISHFRLIFCDEGGKPPCCDADAGFIPTFYNIEACAGADTLNLRNVNFRAGHVLREPDTSEYSYRFLISRDGIFIGHDSIPDLSGYTEAGTYQVCGLSYKTVDSLLLPVADGTLTVDDIRTNLNGATPDFCGDITVECLDVVINVASPPTEITDTICSGQSLVVGDSTFVESGQYSVMLANQDGCDSLVNIDLLVAEIKMDTLTEVICEGQFFTVGTSVYDATGFYSDVFQSALLCDSIVFLDLLVATPVDTLLEVTICAGDSVQIGTETFNSTGNHQVTLTSALGCDSIVNLQLTVVEAEAIILPGGAITCTDTEITLDGSTATGSQPPSFQWRDSNGTPLGSDDTLAVSDAGAYILEITVEENGLLCSAFDTLTVLENRTPPIADAGVRDTITCAESSIQIGALNTSQGLEFSYDWQTTNGSFVSATNLLQPLVGAAGDYTLIVTNNGNGCTATATVRIDADNSLPVVDAGQDQFLTCNVTAATLDGSGSDQGADIIFEWGSDNNTPINNANTLTPEVSVPDRYWLVATDVLTGCNDTAFVSVALDTISPLISLPEPGVLNCENRSLQLNATGSDNGANFNTQWSVSNGGNFTSGTDGLMPTVDAAGSYTLTIENTDNGCISTTDVEIIDTTNNLIVAIDPPALITCNLPIVRILALGSSVGDDITYAWTTTDGTIVSDTNIININVTAVGLYTLTALDTLTRCSATGSVTVDINQSFPTATVGNPGLLTCLETTAALDGNGSSTGPDITYLWTGPGPIETPTAPTTSTTSPGEYILMVTNQTTGCSTSETVLIDQNIDTPQITAINGADLSCSLSTTTLNVAATGDNLAFSWSGPGIVVDGDTNAPTVSMPGLYTVTVLNTVSGCEAVESITIDGGDRPTVDAGPNQVIDCNVSQVGLGGPGTAIGPEFTYRWFSNEGNIIGNTDSPTTTADAGGVYGLIVTNTTDGCADTSLTTVLIDTMPPFVDAGSEKSLSCSVATEILDGSNSENSPDIRYSWTGPCITTPADGTTIEIDCEGTYVLQLENTTTGCVGTDTVVVNRDPNVPMAIAAPSASISCSTGSAVIDASASGGGTVQWFFEDNLLPTTSLMPAFSDPGNYTLVVTNIIAGCSDTTAINVDIDCEPVIDLVAAADTITCDQRAIDLATSVTPAGPAYVYAWTTADGASCFLQGQSDSTAQVSCGGTYRLIVSNPILQLSDTIEVEVLDLLEDPNIVIAPPAAITCSTPGTTINANNSSAGPEFQFTWTNESGDTVGDQRIITVDTGGTYTLELTNQISGCTQTAITQVIDDRTILDITFENTVLPCDTDTTQLTAITDPSDPAYLYAWSGPGIIEGADTREVTIELTGTYLLEITDPANNCTTTESVEVVQPACPPCITITPPVELNCNTPRQNLEVNLCKPCIGCTFEWTTIGGLIESGADSATPSVSSNGTYTVIVSDQQGLRSRASVVVTADFLAPAADTGPDGTLTCLQSNVLIGTANIPDPNIEFRWTDAVPTLLSTDGQLTVDAPGIYNLEVRNITNGCSATDEVEITIDTLAPQIVIAATEELNCRNEMVIIDASRSIIANAASFAWVGPDVAEIRGSTTPNPAIDTPGNYTLTIEDLFNGCRSTETVSVLIDNEKPAIESINTGMLNCQETAVTLAGNLPAPTGFTFEWCRMNPDGSQTNCDATNLDLTTNQPGDFIFRVLSEANGCDSSILLSVEQNITTPTIDAGTPDTLTCTETEIELNGTILNNTFSNQVTWSTIGGGDLSDPGITNPTVSEPGQYVFNVINLTNFCGTADTVEILENLVIPTVDVGNDQVITCASESIEILGQTTSSAGAVAVNWSTTDGNILSPTGSDILVTNAAGTYIFAVADLSNGCLNSAEIVVSIDTLRPTALINDSGPLLLNCSRDTVMLDASASFTASGTTPEFSWSALNAGTSIIGGVTNDIVTVKGLGIYRLVVEDPTNNCTDLIDLPIGGDFTEPSITFAPPVDLTCLATSSTIDASASSSGNQFSYTWTDDSGNILATDQPQLVVSAAGNYELSILDNTNGCTKSEIVTVGADTIPPVASIATPDILDCVVRSVRLDGGLSSKGEAYSYSWSTANGLIIDGGDAILANVSRTGVYSLRVRNEENGCDASATVEVIEIASAIADANIVTVDPACGAENRGSIQVESVSMGTDPFTYAINNQTFVSSNQFRNLTAGTYQITIQGSDGCTWETEVTLNPPEEIAVDLGPDQNISLGDSISINAEIFGNDIDTIMWEPDFLFSDPSALSQWVKPFKNALYKVIVVNSDGCSATDEVLIKVNQEEQLYFPTAFSPNGDDSNENFTIFAGNNIRQINRLQIFNRWGALIFTQEFFMPNDPSIGWDGTYNGEVLNPAVFVYYAEVEFIDGSVKLFKGDLALLR